MATKNQLFQFNGNLYEQVDRVAMGSPLGPLMANAFMCSMEEKITRENRLPSFYKRYVDDTLAQVHDFSDTADLFACLNEAHPSIQFTMEVATNDQLPFSPGPYVEKMTSVGISWSFSIGFFAEIYSLELAESKKLCHQFFQRWWRHFLCKWVMTSWISHFMALKEA